MGKTKGSLLYRLIYFINEKFYRWTNKCTNCGGKMYRVYGWNKKECRVCGRTINI